MQPKYNKYMGKSKILKYVISSIYKLPPMNYLWKLSMDCVWQLPIEYLFCWENILLFKNLIVHKILN